MYVCSTVLVMLRFAFIPNLQIQYNIFGVQREHEHAIFYAKCYAYLGLCYNEPMPPNLEIGDYGLLGLAIGFSYLISKDLIAVIKGRGGVNGDKILLNQEKMLRSLHFEEKIINALDRQTLILQKLVTRIEGLENTMMGFREQGH
jgi:hypothetical protein